MSNKQAVTQGVHHVGLTVDNVKEAAQFFVEALGFNEIGSKADYPVIFISDGTVMLTLWQVQEAGASFNRKANVGLHHFALRLAEGVDFAALGQTLAQRSDVTIEFQPEPLGETGLQHMMCLIPSGIRLELIAA